MSRSVFQEAKLLFISYYILYYLTMLEYNSQGRSQKNFSRIKGEGEWDMEKWRQNIKLEKNMLT